MNVTLLISDLDFDDVSAAWFAVKNENKRRGALTPPVVALPLSSPQERIESYRKTLEALVAAQHAAFIALDSNLEGELKKEEADAFREATPATREEAVALLKAGKR